MRLVDEPCGGVAGRFMAMSVEKQSRNASVWALSGCPHGCGDVGHLDLTAWLYTPIGYIMQSVKSAFQLEMVRALEERKSQDFEREFAHLERAHILGQRHLWRHYQVHIRMLSWGLAQRDRRETVGQVARLVAVLPGWMFGWVPLGNTGGANISALKPLPLDEDVQKLFGTICIARDIGRRIVIWLLVIGLAGLGLHLSG